MIHRIIGFTWFLQIVILRVAKNLPGSLHSDKLLQVEIDASYLSMTNSIEISI